MQPAEPISGCQRWESNPHSRCRETDFEAGALTEQVPATAVHVALAASVCSQAGIIDGAAPAPAPTKPARRWRPRVRIEPPPGFDRSAQTFRLAQQDFGEALWAPTWALSDAQLNAGGYSLAGPGRDGSALDPYEFQFLVSELGRPASRRVSDDVLEPLLARCPFYGWLPPIDIDVGKDHPLFDATRTPAETLAAARRLSARGAEVGLGEIVWYRTNDRGGLHGHVAPPAGWRSRNLLRAAGLMVAELAGLVGAPVAKGPASPWYVDVSLFNRVAERSGVQWRLVGSRKPGGAPKALLAGEPDRDPAPPTAPQALARWRAAIERLDAADARGVRVVPGRDPKPERLARVGAAGSAGADALAERQVRCVSASPADLADLSRHPRAAAAWEHAAGPSAGGDRSPKRYNRFAVRALEAGVPEETVRRLLFTLRSADAGRTDRRDDRFVGRVLDWARSKFHRRVTQPIASAARGIHPSVRTPPPARALRVRLPDRTAPTTEAQRALLRAAAPYGLTPRVRRSLERAADCRRYLDEVVCAGCEEIERSTTMVCERECCPYCAPTRLRSLRRWLQASWPERVAAVEVQPSSMSPGAASSLGAAIARRLPRDVRGRSIRLIGPGSVVILTPAPGDAPTLASVAAGVAGACLAPSVLDRAAAVELVVANRLLRQQHLANLFAAGDPQDLGSDLWVGNVRSVSYGRSGHLPWPTRDELRGEIRSAFAEQASIASDSQDQGQPCSCTDCCGAPRLHRLTDTFTGRVLATRVSPAWRFDEAVTVDLASGASVGRPWTEPPERQGDSFYPYEPSGALYG